MNDCPKNEPSALPHKMPLPEAGFQERMIPQKALIAKVFIEVFDSVRY
jgi:hypothetical protein